MYFRERSTLRAALTIVINWFKTSEIVHRFITTALFKLVQVYQKKASLICFDEDHTESSGNENVSLLHAYNNNKFI